MDCRVYMVFMSRSFICVRVYTYFANGRSKVVFSQIGKADRVRVLLLSRKAAELEHMANRHEVVSLRLILLWIGLHINPN